MRLLLVRIVGTPDEPNPRIAQCNEFLRHPIIRIIWVEEGNEPKAWKSQPLKNDIVDVLVAKAKAHNKQNALILDDLPLKLAKHVRIG